MALQIYNTMTRQKEPFETIEPGVVRMYVCGVTVYDDSHIGHALMAITFDVIRRYLEWSGYKVKHAQNFTDVDDKIINRAAQYGMDPLEFAGRYIDAWMEESEALNVLPATVYPRASNEVVGMLEMIGSLIEDGHAYQSDNGDVNYDVTTFDEYGKLSHRKLDDLLAGARVAVDPTKRHPMDFVLWKAAKPGEPAWDSPWGPGRPGWHIECSVMAAQHLNGQMDIHGGGADLIFPHHENEIAQSESFEESKPFSRYWVHNALLQFKGEKMSKSVGNLVKTREIIDNGDAGPFRLMVLQTHYRHPLTFTDEGMESARRGFERLVNAVRDAEPADDVGSTSIDDTIAEAEERFRAAMDDDFNAPVAVSVLFDLARLANQSEGNERSAAQAKLIELAGVLGLSLQTDSGAAAESDAGPFIELLLELRQQLRAEKQYALADSIRDRLTDLGVTVEDTAEGSSWRWSS
ncbi:MAG: cysteine--tRNA ligase [Thermomicrobiales bacterium]